MKVCLLSCKVHDILMATNWVMLILQKKRIKYIDITCAKYVKLNGLKSIINNKNSLWYSNIKTLTQITHHCMSDTNNMLKIYIIASILLLSELSKGTRLSEV